jgi:hypothetical protein
VCFYLAMPEIRKGCKIREIIMQRGKQRDPAIKEPSPSDFSCSFVVILRGSLCYYAKQTEQNERRARSSAVDSSERESLAKLFYLPVMRRPINGYPFMDFKWKLTDVVNKNMLAAFVGNICAKRVARMFENARIPRMA